MVSGEPNITPIFMRIWLMKMTIVRDFAIARGQLAQRLAHQARLEADVASPISPSISAFGVSAATESMTIDVDRVRAHEHVGDLERLLAEVRLD